MASEERILNYVEHIVDDTAGGKDIRIFNLSGWLTGKYEQAMTARRKLNYGYDILDFCGNATEIVLAGVRDLCCYFYLLSMMQKGMSVGNFVFYLGLISGFASWFSQLSKTYGEMRKNNHQVNEFRSIVDEEKEGLEHKKYRQMGLMSWKSCLTTFPIVIQVRRKSAGSDFFYMGKRGTSGACRLKRCGKIDAGEADLWILCSDERSCAGKRCRYAGAESDRIF